MIQLLRNLQGGRLDGRKLQMTVFSPAAEILRIKRITDRTGHTGLILEEMNVKEEDKITMCELFDQYTRRGKQEGIKEGIKTGIKALISTCRELGVSFDETAARVKENFSLGDEETRNNMQLYW